MVSTLYAAFSGALTGADALRRYPRDSAARG